MYGTQRAVGVEVFKKRSEASSYVKGKKEWYFMLEMVKW